MKGHLRWRGQSIEVRVYAGKGKTVTRTIKWQGTKKATKDAADRVLRGLLDDLDVTAVNGSDVTVAKLVGRWRQHAEPDWSPTTRAAYESYLRLHVLPALGDRKIGAVTPADLDDFYASLRAKGLSAASIGKVHVILRRAFGEAVRWRWLRTNPVADARPPKVARPDLNPPTAEQVNSLLDLAAERYPDFHAFLVLAADTGARRGELCAIRWKQVDLDKGELVIDRAVVLDSGGVTEKGTKTHQARRIALGPAAVAALAAHRVRCLEQARKQTKDDDLAARQRVKPNAFVFSTDLAAGSTPWRPDVVTTKFIRLRKRAGVENVRLHDLRHALVTSWLASGVDPRTVMGRVGHASLQTLTRYSHFVAAADREAADRLGSLLGRSAEG